MLLPDDDFLINPFYIEDIICIAQEFNVKLVVTDCILARPSYKTIGKSGHSGLINGKFFIDRFMKTISIPTIANLFDRDTALKLNAFHSNIILYSDIELWMKIMSTHDVYCYDIPSVYYLFHNDNIVMNMSIEELINNSEYIKPSIDSFADDQLIYNLVCRYILSINGIYNVNLIKYGIIKKIFMKNEIIKNPLFLIIKYYYCSLKISLINIIKLIYKRL